MSADGGNTPAGTVTAALTLGGMAKPQAGSRLLAEEVPIAIVPDGATHAVMMASPVDLEDFGVGFALSEGIVATPADIREMEVVTHPAGIEIRLWLEAGASRQAIERRRLITGPTGCGLCGIDSLEAARKPARRITADLKVDGAAISAAMAAMAEAQVLGRATRATHAAAFHLPGRGLVALREDVGRHNALDKLIGALARDGIDGGTGLLTITSRVSIEMVQKAAILGTPILAAVSAPTALAVDTAEAAGLTLIAVARGDSFEVFSGGARISGPG